MSRRTIGFARFHKIVASNSLKFSSNNVMSSNPLDKRVFTCSRRDTITEELTSFSRYSNLDPSGSWNAKVFERGLVTTRWTAPTLPTIPMSTLLVEYPLPRSCRKLHSWPEKSLLDLGKRGPDGSMNSHVLVVAVVTRPKERAIFLIMPS